MQARFQYFHIDSMSHVLFFKRELQKEIQIDEITLLEIPKCLYLYYGSSFLRFPNL